MAQMRAEISTRIEQLRVVLHVRDEVYRHGLESVLHRTALGTIDSCQTASGLHALLRSHEYDVVISTSSVREWELTLPASTAFPRPRVLMLLDDGQLPEPRAGTPAPDGYLLRGDVTSGSLAVALRRTADGEMPMPPEVARQLIAQAAVPEGAHAPQILGALTARQNETLALLAAGLSNKQIARRLHISEHGAKRLVASVLLKLGSPNRTAAVVTAMKEGLLERP